MGEDLPPFSEAYEKDFLINEDNDYFMDDLEDLMDLTIVFAEEVRSQPLLVIPGAFLTGRLWL